MIKTSLNVIKEYAINKNGLLISEFYINAHSKLEWQCERGHQWEATWHNVRKHNSWCPDCIFYKTEKKCQIFLEEKLKIKLNKKRFYYNNQRLEFDGYNKENKIAFEYHGYQHYIYPNQYHKTEEAFKNAQQRDILKEQYSKENGIKLIVIPYTEEKNLEQFINKTVKEIYVNH